MYLRGLYLLTVFLFSLTPYIHAGKILPVDVTHQATAKIANPLTLDTLFRPKGNSKSTFGLSSLSYTFNCSTADTINTARLCLATDSSCTTCNTNFTIIVGGVGDTLNCPVTGAPGATYSVPPASVVAYLNSQSLPSGNYNIGLYVQSTNTNCAGNTTYCSTNESSTAGNPLLCMQATYDSASGGSLTALAQNDGGLATLNSPAPDATIDASVNTLALATSGIDRTITLTNLGTTPASGVGYTPSPALPSGTSIAPLSCGSIAVLGTCVLTITPGGTASAVAYNISPTPITLTIVGSNTNTLNPTTNILTYGSVYQSGYLFSIDDTTAATGSIGGKIAALTDQAPAYPDGTVWSSDGTGSSNVSYDIISGIDETSTTSAPSPALNPPPTLSACNGATNGSCDSNNIVTYYNYFRTGGGTPPTPLTDYSAGLCANYTIDSAGNAPCVSGNACYTGWFLPSICEMGPDSGNSICSTSSVESNIVDNLPSLLGDGTEGGTCTAVAGCISGLYWSSTEDSGNPQYFAWVQYFAASGGSDQNLYGKSLLLGVRCSRALTI